MKQAKTTTSHAIRHARAQIGDLFPIGDGWAYLTWDADYKAYRQAHSQPYHSAREQRAANLIEAAVFALTGDEDDAFRASYDYLNERPGSRNWVDYVG